MRLGSREDLVDATTGFRFIFNRFFFHLSQSPSSQMVFRYKYSPKSNLFSRLVSVDLTFMCANKNEEHIQLNRWKAITVLLIAVRSLHSI